MSQEEQQQMAGEDASLYWDPEALSHVWGRKWETWEFGLCLLDDTEAS